MALGDLFRSGFFRARYLIPAVAANAVALAVWFGIQGALLDNDNNGAESPPGESPAPGVASTAPASSDGAQSQGGTGEAGEPLPNATPPVFPNVLVADRDISAGVMLVPDMMEWREWRDPIDFNLAVLQDAVPLQAVVGAVTQEPFEAGRPLTWDGLILPGGPGFISAVIEPGMRAITVEVDRATTNANIIYPGDRVDVILIYVDGQVGADAAALGGAAQAIVSNVRVLAVGSTIFTLGRYGKTSPINIGTIEPAPQPEGENYTLEVTPRDAEIVALAASSGRLTLAMRNVSALSDASGFGALPVRLRELMARPEPPPASVPVRVIRGGAGRESPADGLLEEVAGR